MQSWPDERFLAPPKFWRKCGSRPFGKNALVGGTQLGIADAPRAHVARCRRLQDRVRRTCETVEEVSSDVGADVEGDAALAGVEGQPRQAVLAIYRVVKKGSPRSSRLTPRWLDLDDVGAHVSENLAGEKTGFVGEVEDAKPGEHVFISAPA